MIADKTKVELIFTGPSGGEMANVLHYEQTGDNALDFDLVSLTAFVADISNIMSAYLNCFTSNCTVNMVRATVLSGNVAGLQAVDASANGTPGASTGGAGSIERCGIIRLRSLYVGRANRGRIYTVAPPSTMFNVDGSFLSGFTDAAHFAALQASLLVGRAGPATACMYLTILHAGTFVGSPVYVTDIGPKCGIQRRRLLA